jgi:hypothetical protein
MHGDIQHSTSRLCDVSTILFFNIFENAIDNFIFRMKTIHFAVCNKICHAHNFFTWTKKNYACQHRMLQYGYCPKTTRKILLFAIIRDAYHMNFTSMLLSQTKWRSVQSQQTEPYAYEIKYASTFLFHNNTSRELFLIFFCNTYVVYMYMYISAPRALWNWNTCLCRKLCISAYM